MDSASCHTQKRNGCCGPIGRFRRGRSRRRWCWRIGGGRSSSNTNNSSKKQTPRSPRVGGGSLPSLTGGRRKKSDRGHATETFAAVGEAEAALARHGQHALAAVGDLVAPLAHFDRLAPAGVNGDPGGEGLPPNVVSRHPAPVPGGGVAGRQAPTPPRAREGNAHRA